MSFSQENRSNKLNNLKSSIILIDTFFALFIFFSCIRRKVELPGTKSWGTVSHRIADQVSQNRVGAEDSQGVLAFGSQEDSISFLGCSDVIRVRFVGLDCEDRMPLLCPRSHVH